MSDPNNDLLSDGVRAFVDVARERPEAFADAMEEDPEMVRTAFLELLPEKEKECDYGHLLLCAVYARSEECLATLGAVAIARGDKDKSRFIAELKEIREAFPNALDPFWKILGAIGRAFQGLSLRHSELLMLTAPPGVA